MSCEYPYHRTVQLLIDTALNEFGHKAPSGVRARGGNIMCPDDFRDRAVECMHLAQHAHDPRHRSVLLDMAYSWTDLANAADRFESLAEPVEPRLIRNIETAPRIRASLSRVRQNQQTSRSATVVDLQRHRATGRL